MGWPTRGDPKTFSLAVARIGNLTSYYKNREPPVLDGDAASEDDDDPADFAFGQFAFPPQIINGTFEMTLGTKVIVPEISASVFDDSDTTKRKFSYKLDNPKWLKPSMDITPKLNMPKAVSGDKVFNPAVKVILLGTMTEKA